MADSPANPPRATFLPVLAVSACGAMWGLYWLPLRWFEAQGLGGAWSALLFNLVALAVTLPWLLRARRWTGLADQAVTGLFLGTAFTLYTVSLVLTDVIHAILLFYLTPVWSTLAGWLLLRERVTVARVLAVACGFAGLWCILGDAGGLPLPRSGGDWMALASGVLWSAGTLRSYRRPARSIALSVLSFAAGGLVSAVPVLAVAAGAGSAVAGLGNVTAVLPAVVAVALVVYVPPTFLVLWAAQRLDPGRVGILLMGEVLVGSASAALYAGEAFAARELLGTAFIAAAGLIEVLGRR
jgi:drug/metabolite transporter (DMT)-like permease